MNEGKNAEGENETIMASVSTVNPLCLMVIFFIALIHGLLSWCQLRKNPCTWFINMKQNHVLKQLFPSENSICQVQFIKIKG